ncbi:MAG: cupin domain-containing protein [Candidatus Omnitrophica bacterium]|nr:cupin domain-containing protein [Candidatus Omnitrophota bacterium]
MIKKKDDCLSEIRKNMRGGLGEVRIKHYLKSNELKAPCRLCAELVLPAGAQIGMHEHNGEDEIFIIQKGRALINDNGNYAEVEEGDIILTGTGSAHSVKNISDSDLVITAIIIKYNS